MRILLIMGGWSSERDVSLAGAKVVHDALLRLGHTVTPFDPAKSFSKLLPLARQHDFAFIALHGSPGEDGLVQVLLERANCPYQGANSSASLLALNKSASKTVFHDAGIPTANWLLLSEQPPTGWVPPLPFPLFIKANTGGSSLHMARVQNQKELDSALPKLFTFATEYIVETAITGIEVTCGILGEWQQGIEVPVPLPPILIKSKSSSGIFDYTSKYSPGGAEELCPAPIGALLTEKVQQSALKAHLALGLSGYSRADFIIPEDGEPILLEVNTLPGMTATSLLPQEAAAFGLSFDALIERLIELGSLHHTAHCLS